MKVVFDFEKEEISLICYALKVASVQVEVDRTADKMNVLWEKLKPFSGDKC